MSFEILKLGKFLLVCGCVLLGVACGAGVGDTANGQEALNMSSAADAGINACAVVSDCQGFLPQSCMVCPGDGAVHCAHWSCEQNSCAIAMCP
jgi:hypothetical protein